MATSQRPSPASTFSASQSLRCSQRRGGRPCRKESSRIALEHLWLAGPRSKISAADSESKSRTTRHSETAMQPRFGYLLPTREKIMDNQPHVAPLLELAERAERLGFDSIWAGDSVLARPRHEP